MELQIAGRYYIMYMNTKGPGASENIEIQNITYSLTHSLNHPLTYLLTYLLTYSLHGAESFLIS